MWGIIVGIVGFLVDAAVSVAEAVWAALVAVWAVMGPILAAVWSALSGIWSNVLRPMWTILKGWGLEVYKLYTKYVEPVVDRIQKITKLVRRVYATFIQPVRDLLSILQQFLTLTHLNHTALGQAIDSELARIDGEIAKVWAQLTKPLNVALKLLNEVILDVNGLLQAPLLLESTATYMGHILDQWWGQWNLSLTKDWSEYLASWKEPLTAQHGISSAKDLLEGKPGHLTPHLNHAVRAFDLVAQDQADQLTTAGLDPGPGGLA